MSRDICSVEVYTVGCDGHFEPLWFVVACPLESYKNSKEMRGAVSPLRGTLILIVPHLQLKRAGIRRLSSCTGNTGTYIPAGSTLLILLWCLRFSRYIYTMICVVALCRTSSSPLLKLNTAMTYKIGTKALSAILDAMKLICSPPVDSCSEYDPNDSCSKLPHI